MNDDTMALAALKAGCQWFPDCTSMDRFGNASRFYSRFPHGGVTKSYDTPIEALAAAGRALGLVPDVVVMPAETAANAIAGLPWAVENARACAGEAVDEAARKAWTRHADVLEATLVALGGEPS